MSVIRIQVSFVVFTVWTFLRTCEYEKNYMSVISLPQRFFCFKALVLTHGDSSLPFLMALVLKGGLKVIKK